MSPSALLEALFELGQGIRWTRGVHNTGAVQSAHYADTSF